MQKKRPTDTPGQLFLVTGPAIPTPVRPARNGQEAALPKPFLKWAGGKGQLLRPLEAGVSRARPFGRYFEPFLGAGALFFHLYRLGWLHEPPKLSDNNGRLIETWLALQQDHEAVMQKLREHKARHGKEHYYRVRGSVPENLSERAARIIYLNRTGFNGLYRENSKGEFNVPMGKYANPMICDEDNLPAVARALQGVEIGRHHFAAAVADAVPGDLVYFDPPYDPVSKTASFTAYHQEGFGEDSQRELAAVFHALDQRGVKVMLSNSMTSLVRELYGGYNFDEVEATRLVNSRSDRRGKIVEALVCNF